MRFLIYVDRTYPWLSPYIKGLHLTIDSWRPGREELGFKMRGKELVRALAAWAKGRGLPCRQEDDDTDGVAPPPPREARESQGRPEDEAPGDVRPVPRFRRDVACLLELTELRVAVVEQYGVEYEAGPWKMQWRKESSIKR